MTSRGPHFLELSPCIIPSLWVRAGFTDLLLKNRKQSYDGMSLLRLGYYWDYTASRLDTLTWFIFPQGSCVQRQFYGDTYLARNWGCQHHVIKLEVNPISPSRAFMCDCNPGQQPDCSLMRGIKPMKPHHPDSCPQTLRGNKYLLFQSFRIICYTAVDN